MINIYLLFCSVILQWKGIIMNRHNIPTDLNRTKRTQSLRKISLEKVKPFTQASSPGGDIALKNIVEEVIKYFMEIIQVLLIQQNSNHFLEFMKKTEQMNRELQRKMELLIEQKYQQLINIISKEELTKEKFLRIDSNAQLKKERKQVARRIINYHRSASSTLQLKSAQQLPQLLHSKPQRVPFEANDSNSFEQKQMKTSMELNSLNSQITELQKIQSSAVNQLKNQLQSKIQYNFKDIEKLHQKYLDFKLKFEEKIQQNLTAIWNVIGDIKTSVFSLENLVYK